MNTLDYRSTDGPLDHENRSFKSTKVNSATKCDFDFEKNPLKKSSYLNLWARFEKRPFDNDAWARI